MMSLAPVVTVILSLLLYQVVPHPVVVTGMILAFISSPTRRMRSEMKSLEKQDLYSWRRTPFRTRITPN